MVTKVLMYIHTEKQKERVETSWTIHPTCPQHSETHHSPPQTPCHSAQRPSHHSPYTVPIIHPPPQWPGRDHSPQRPCPLSPTVNLLITHPGPTPNNSSHRFPISLPSTSLLTDTHFLSHTMVSLVIRKACGQGKKAPCGLLSAGGCSLSQGQGIQIFPSCVCPLVLENHPWGPGTVGEVIHCLGDRRRQWMIGSGSFRSQRALRFTL